ncbi:MAG: peptidylprolyl isomerase [Planctomycetota bacterium]
MTDSALQEIREYAASKSIDTKKKDWRIKLPAPPRVTFDGKSEYFWNMETSEGPLRIKLREDVAPRHVASTIFLNELGFYDGLDFHRVISQFMAQGGCPLGNGRGGPGFKYDGEFDGGVKHDRPGLLSMANAGPGTDGSQFFLTFVPTPWLDGKHTIFGQVEGGEDVLTKLEEGGSAQGTPKRAMKIVKGTIEVVAKG